MDPEAGIRAATTGDLQAAMRLLADAGLPTDDVDAGRLALVAVRDERVAGLIGLEQVGSLGLLRSLVIEPGSRARGLGKRLVVALENLAAGRGILELWLLTIDADRFFERFGYERQPRTAAPAAIVATREFSTLCPGDAVLMKKDLRR